MSRKMSPSTPRRHLGEWRMKVAEGTKTTSVCWSQNWTKPLAN